MVTITVMSNVDHSKYDEVWAIVRSLKYANQKIRHVPELSPSWALFKKYLSLREAGKWNDETFHNIYVPWFLKEMRGKKQQNLLNELFNTKKHICLVCFCPEEELCHRSIIGGMLQGAGLMVNGLSKDYGYYFDWWKNGVPGMSKSVPNIPGHKIEDYCANIKYLYRLGTENLFDDETPTLCFTGRRPKDLCWYETIKYRPFVDEFVKLLYNEFYVNRGIRRFISGGAQGFDQMAFWAVNKMKKTYGCENVQNVLFLPFEHQEIRWAEKGCFSQAEYWMMVNNADMTVIVSDDNSIQSLFMRNHAMCDHSLACLGLYPDDTWRTNKGGTSECLRYAAEHCRDVYRLGYEIDSLGLHMGELTKV